jgi:nitrogen fixation/metabolism regulation signal transduction histidine kinase
VPILSLRARFVAYLAVMHLIFGALAVYLLLPERRAWLIAVEALFAVSLAVGISMIGRLLRALAFAGDSAQFLQDSDYTTRFLPVQQPEIDRLIGVYNRMVDSLRAERQRVQEQHFFLGRILEVSPSGIVVLDHDGRLDLVNPAASRILEHPAGALRGRPLPASGVPMLESLAALGPGEDRVLPLHGGRRVRVRHGTFVDRGFARSFYLLEELTEELRRTEKAAYDKLIRLMSHEVNNSVGASGSLLHSSLAYGRQLAPGDRADFERALGIAIERMEQLNVFMRGFADVVRLPPPARQPTDLAEMLERIETLTAAGRASRGIAWHWVRDGQAPLLALDRVQLEQALVNIVKNGIEAAGDGGRLTIHLGVDNGRVRLVVEDSGPGIPEDVRPHLFTPFFTSKPDGQGIGLTMVQEILSNHGVEFSLDGPDGGPTRFTMDFPC